MSHGLGQSLRDGLRAAVDALGGYKLVGHWLRPEMHPELADQWLAHCLTRGRRDKLSLDQVEAILRRAHAAGLHDGMQRICAGLGYAPPAPIDSRDAIAGLLRRADAAAQAATSLTVEARELMRHAGLKVDEL